MAGEENQTVTNGTFSDPETQPMDIGAKTASFSNNECSVKTQQTIDGNGETVPLKVGEVSSSGKASSSCLNVYVRKKRFLQKCNAGLKAKPEVEADAEASSSVVVRKSTRSRKSSVKKEMNLSVEDVKEERSGRKRKIISSSDAPQEGEENGGRKRNITKKEPESDDLGEESQDSESETPIVEIKGYSFRNRDRKPKYIEKEDRKSKYIEKEEVPKVNKLDPKWIEEESLMCHQCQRNDKGRVVRCTRCKRKRYCIPCLNNWYPQLEEDDIAEACPVCRGNCNCKACLRYPNLINEIKEKAEKEKTEGNTNIEHSKYLMKALLPYVKQLDEEQMVEKEIEAKRQGLSLSELKIEVADYFEDERVYCDNCRTSIFDYHRSCTKCSFDLCVLCCRELRGGQLPGGADPIKCDFIFRGCDYMHGGENKGNRKIVQVAAEPEIREWSRSGWLAESDGGIPCPKANKECDHGFLELRSIHPPNHISELVCKAEELAEAYKLQDSEVSCNNSCSCLKLAKNTTDIYNNTRKAASREDSSDNCLYCPRAVDLHHRDLSHFQWHWSKGEPVIVSNVLECTSGLSWEPFVMWRAFRQISSNRRTKHDVHLDVKAIDCLDWCESQVRHSRQF